MRYSQPFQINFSALHFNEDMTLEGGVSGTQTYNADTGEHVPNYEAAPLILQPKIGVIDKDGYIATGKINAKLYNITWSEIIDGVTKTITTDSEYTVTGAGSDTSGRLTVMKNSEPLHPVTLRFQARYRDPRNGQVHTFRMTHLVTCGTVSSSQRLDINTPSTQLYNPLEDSDTLTVTPSFLVGATEVTYGTEVGQVQYVIERKVGSVWYNYGSNITDVEVTQNDDGTITINRWLMGAELNIRIRAKYSATEAPADVELTEVSPCVEIHIARRLPKLECNYTGAMGGLPYALEEMQLTAHVRGTKKEYEDFERVLSATWYYNLPDTTVYNKIAEGKEVAIPISTVMDSDNTTNIVLDVVENDYAAIWVDEDGDALTDEDGNILII